MGSNPCPLLRLTVFLKYSVYSYDHVFIELQIQYTLRTHYKQTNWCSTQTNQQSAIQANQTLAIEEFVNHLLAVRDL